MSIEKVRRYNTYETFNCADGRYIEYADVAGLVESSDAVLDAAKVIQINFADSDYYSVPKHILDALRNELARWTA